MQTYKNKDNQESLMIRLSYNNQIYEISAGLNTEANELRKHIFS